MAEKSPPPRRAEKGTFKDGEWNRRRRPRGEYLTRDEIESLCAAAAGIGRHRHRDSTMIWVGFVHGLRAAELADLRIEQYEPKANRLTVNRVKNGRTSIHIVEHREKAALKELVGDRRTGHVFRTERDTPLSPSGILKIIAQAGEKALDKDGEPVINFPVHPHMLRHSCGYWLNESGRPIRHIQEWLGHKNIRHTERYAAMSPRHSKTSASTDRPIPPAASAAMPGNPGAQFPPRLGRHRIPGAAEADRSERRHPGELSSSAEEARDFSIESRR